MIRGWWRDGDIPGCSDFLILPRGPQYFVHLSTTPGRPAKDRLPPSAPWGEQTQELSYVWFQGSRPALDLHPRTKYFREGEYSQQCP